MSCWRELSDGCDGLQTVLGGMRARCPRGRKQTRKSMAVPQQRRPATRRNHDHISAHDMWAIWPAPPLLSLSLSSTGGTPSPRSRNGGGGTSLAWTPQRQTAALSRWREGRNGVVGNFWSKEKTKETRRYGVGGARWRRPEGGDPCAGVANGGTEEQRVDRRVRRQRASGGGQLPAVEGRSGRRLDG